MSKSLGSFYSKALLAETASVTEVQYQTGLLAAGEAITFELAINQAFLLSKLIVSHPCRVRLYCNNTNRTNDLNRGEGTPVNINSGVAIDSVLTAGNTEITYNPAINIINNDNPQSSIVYFTITNKSGGPADINLKLSVVPLLPVTKPEWILVERSVQIANDSNPYQLDAGQSYLLGKSTRLIKPFRGSFKVYCLSDDIKIDNDLLEPYHYYEFVYSESKGEWIMINFKKRPRGLAAGEATNTTNMIFSGRFLSNVTINSSTIHYLKKIVVSSNYNLPKPMSNYINYSAKLISNHIPTDQLIN